MSASNPAVTIYTDGGANPNPGPGGYGVLLLFPDREQELSGGDRETTNNRMELTAACVALESLTAPHHVILYTDSEYVKKGITLWLDGWVRKNWKDVKNPDLWQRLHRATQRHQITWKWVRGHAGNQHNERVDRLATAARERITGKRSASTTAAPDISLKDAPAATFDYTVFASVDYHRSAKAGGWAVLIRGKDGSTSEISRGRARTTEYELALWATVTALESLPPTGSVLIHTDNETVQKGASGWIKGWRKNGWKNAKGEPVAHQELWQRLDAVIRERTVSWQWSQGINPQVDALAAQERRKMTGQG